MKKLVISRTFYCSLIFVFFIGSSPPIQKRGIKKAQFSPEKIVFTEIDAQGNIQKTELTVPKGYVAIRGDGFTNAFVLNRYDRNGDKNQTIPVVNLYKKVLRHHIVTYLGQDTIQLPDKVFAKGHHFMVKVKETFQPSDEEHIWINDQGILILDTAILTKYGAFVIYQEDYHKNSNTGIITALLNGLYFGYTKWTLADSANNFLILKLQAAVSKRFGGFNMSVNYTLDKNFAPISYKEHWTLNHKSQSTGWLFELGPFQDGLWFLINMYAQIFHSQCFWPFTVVGIY